MSKHMKNNIKWRFLTYPKSLFALICLGAIACVAIGANYHDNTKVEDGQIIAAAIFFTAAAVVFSFKQG